MSFIKLDRKLLTWEWKDDPNMVALWVEILLQANYCDSTWHGHPYERGSFPTSIDKLSVATGLSKRQTRTCLEKLKSTHEVTIQATNHGSKIIVNKWADYQCCDDDSDTQIDTQNANKRHAIDTQVDNTIRNKERKKERKEEINSNTNVLLAPTLENVDAFARLPLLENKFYLISYEEVEHYKEQFPAVDVEQEIRNAIAWTEANPKNRKKQGKRFLTNWLLRKQERARAYSERKNSGVTYIDIE